MFAHEDNDDKQADFSKGTLQPFNALGYIAADGFHSATGEVLGLVCESAMFLQLIRIVKILGGKKPHFFVSDYLHIFQRVYSKA